MAVVFGEKKIHACTMKSEGYVAFWALSQGAEQSLRAVCALLGINVRECPPEECERTEFHVEEVICAVLGRSEDRARWEHRGIHVLVIGDSLRLPGCEKAMGQLILADHARWQAAVTPHSSHLCVGVAGWSAGVGVSALAWDLCADTGSVLVNCSGPGPSRGRGGRILVPEDGQVAWSRLSRGERYFLPSIANSLPCAQGVSFVGGDSRGYADSDDSRLPGLLAALRETRSVVCDLGKWGARCEQTARNFDALILIGLGDAVGAARLCALSASFPFPCRSFLLIAPPPRGGFFSRTPLSGQISSTQISQITHTEGMGVHPVGMRPRQGRKGRRARMRLWEQIVERTQ